MRLFAFLLGFGSVLLSVCAGAGVASAQIVVGPYTFPDESVFADTAVHTGGSPSLYGGAGTVEEAVTGYTPTTAIVNMGLSGAEVVELGFTDVRIRNEVGVDVVVFDSRFSTDDYEIAVRPVGGTATAYVLYPSSGQVSTGVAGPSPGTSTLWGVEVDLDDFGLPAGTVVDTVFVKGDSATNPDSSPELDLTMAAVMNGGGCMDASDCDDGNECTVDSCASMVCANDAELAGTACVGGVCNGDTVAPACVECLDDTHCGVPTPRCDTVTSTCVPCLDAADCDDDNECTEDTCDAMECGATALPAGTECTDGVCNGDPAMPLCIECTTDADCGEFAPRCIMNQCVACTEHGDCDDRDACTDDRCDIDGLCVHQALGTPECRPIEDAGPPPDAGARTDAGAPAAPIGGTGRRDGGCGCDAPGTRSDAAAWLAVGLLGLALGLRRRRR